MSMSPHHIHAAVRRELGKVRSVKKIRRSEVGYGLDSVCVKSVLQNT